MEGSTYEQEVEPYEVEIGVSCVYCRELLAEPEDIIAHIYEELLNESTIS